MKKIDIFGSQILLRFKGEDTYNTKLGSIVTLMIIGIIFFRLFFIIKDVFQRTSPEVIYNERQVDNPKNFQMTRETFPFAFSMEDQNSAHYIDETIYTILAEQQTKTLVFNPVTGNNDAVWNITQYKLIPCTQENFGNPDNQNYFLQLTLNTFYCFPPDVILQIEGDFNSKTFSQVRLTVQRCKGSNCQDDSIISKALQRSIFAINFSDVNIDPKIKDQPFQSFARNLFWPTSLNLPSEVNIYLKNNYIMSDYGWFFEDFYYQDKPSYSSTDLAVYPPQFQDFLFQVTIRFEKEKESVYQRKYQNFNSIISEIGGFTQSLLAIGFLICSKLSSLTLNQEIINQAFNYEEPKENDIQENSQDPIENEKDKKLNDTQLQQLSKIRKKSIFGDIKNNNNGNISQQLSVLQDNLSPLSNTQLQKQYFVQPPDQNYNNDIGIEDSNNALRIKSSTNNLFPLHSRYNDKSTQNLQQTSKKVLMRKEGETQDLQQSQNLQDQSQQLLDILVKNEILIEQRKQYQNQNITFKEECAIQKLQLKIHEKEQRIHEIRFKQLMQKQTKSMKLSIFEYIKSILWPFGKLKQKKMIIDYSIDRLYQNLDIFNIIKKLQEVEKLKLLLLDPDQIQLFEYLPKPTIKSDCMINNKNFMSKNSNVRNFDIFHDNRNEIEKVRDAFLSYKSIMNKEQFSKLDQKIIDQIDPNLIGIFQAQYKLFKNIQANQGEQKLQVLLNNNNLQAQQNIMILKESNGQNDFVLESTKRGLCNPEIKFDFINTVRTEPPSVIQNSNFEKQNLDIQGNQDFNQSSIQESNRRNSKYIDNLSEIAIEERSYSPNQPQFQINELIQFQEKLHNS